MDVLFVFLVILFFAQINLSYSNNYEDELITNCKEESEVYPNKKNKFCNLLLLQQETYSRSKQSMKTTVTDIDFQLTDFELLFNKGILTENQAIFIWENLLNTKTERNLEWLEYNKYIRPSASISSISASQSSYSNESKYYQNISILFEEKEFKYHALFAYIGGIVTYCITKLFNNNPKMNLMLQNIYAILNISNCFFFYNKKFLFTSCVCLFSFLSNIYFIYLNTAILCGEKEVDCSIFYVKHFQQKKYFLMKIGICTFLLIILTYLTSLSLRFHLNYVIAFFLFEKMREMIKNYNKKEASLIFRPINSFISIIFGFIIFIYSNVFYYSNLSFSYQLNSFLFVNNFISLYYFRSIDKYVYVQKNNLGDFDSDEENSHEKVGKNEVFGKHERVNKNENQYLNNKLNENNIGIDICIITLSLVFLIGGFVLTTYFYILISFTFLHTLMKHSLMSLHFKIYRITSSLLLLIYLLFISNLAKIKFCFVNEIIALYDQKLLNGLLQLVKLGFYLLLGICFFINEQFFQLFKISNYSSYQLLSNEFNISHNSKLMKILEQAYSARVVITEIFSANIMYSLEKVNSVLEIINDGNSKINELYFETLIQKASLNSFSALLIADYSLIYFTLFILNDILIQSSNSLLYFILLLYRIGLYFKLAVLLFEYSKTPFQQYVYLILTCILMPRIFNYPESDYLDMFFSLFFVALLFVIYMIFIDNSLLVNICFIILNWLYFNVNIKLVFGLPIIYGMILAKNILKFFDTNGYTFIVFITIIFLCAFLFSFLNFEIIKLLYYHLQMGVLKLFGFDLIEIITKFCFVGLNRDEYFEIIIIEFIKKKLNLCREYFGQ